MNNLPQAVLPKDSYAMSLFHSYLSRRFPEGYTEDQYRDALDMCINLGVKQAQVTRKTMNKSRLIWNGKPARSDMIDKLGNILYILRQECVEYPVIKPMTLKMTVQSALRSHDTRTVRKYLDWILENSVKGRGLASVDLSPLLEIFPQEKIEGSFE